MALIDKPITFSTGGVILAAEHNSNFDTLYDDYNGNVDNNNIASNAAIASSKLAAITATSTTTGRTLENRFAEKYNVKDFGATGDGVTDDTVAVTAAVTASVTDGKILYFPAGDYLLTTWAAMTLTDSFHMEGVGRDVVTVTGKDASTNFINLSETGSLHVEGIKFSTFSSVFERKLQTTTAIPYIRIAKCEFKDVLIGLFLNATNATHDDNEVTNIEIFDNEVDTALRGFNCGMLVKHAIVSNNYIHALTSSTATCIAIRIGRDISDGTPEEHVLQGSYIIVDNTIETIQGPGGAESERVAGIQAFGARVVISNNVLQDISLTTPGSDTACNGIYTKARNVVIDGNVIYDVQGNDAVIRIKGQGLEDDPATAHRSHNYVISNNAIWFDPDETTQYESAIDVNVSGRCAIVGNHIENVNFRGIKVAASNAATGSIGAEDVIIANNVISEQLGISVSTAEGIELRDFVNATISGNIINMEATYARGYYGIYVRKTGATYPTAKNLMINNNVINISDPSGEANTLYGITVDQDQANDMKNVNILDNIVSLVSATRAVRCVSFFNSTSLADVVTVRGNDWSQSSGTTTTFIYKTAATTPTLLVVENNYPNPLIAFADDATPSICESTIFKTGGTTTITDFDDGFEGKIITVVAEHSLTITDGTNIFLSGSANWAMTATDTLTLICKSDNKWYEIGRGDNGA